MTSAFPSGGGAGAAGSAARSDEAADVPLRTRILAAFTDRAARDGIRAVVMAELAADLGISTKTLYREFRSKNELVGALMAAWSDQLEVEQAARITTIADPVERMKAAALAIVDGVARHDPRFWSDLAEDHPDHAAVYARAVDRAIARAGEWIGAGLRDDIDLRLAATTLEAAIRTAVDPAVHEPLGIARDDAVTQTVEIWARGALSPRKRRSTR